MTQRLLEAEEMLQEQRRRILILEQDLERAKLDDSKDSKGKSVFPILSDSMMQQWQTDFFFK